MRLKLPTEQIHYALALALTKGISFVMLPFYTYYLSTKAYGQLELLVVFTNLCSILLGFGLIETLYRFCANVDKERQPEVLNQLMLIGLTVALSAMAILMFFAESLNELLPGEFLISDLRLALFNVCLAGLINLPMAWLRLRDRSQRFLIISFVNAAIQASLSLFGLHLGMSLTAILLANAIASLINLLMLLISTGEAGRFRWGKYKAKALMVYAWPFIITGLCGFVLSGFDRYLLADIISLEQLASYALAMKFALLPILIIQPFTLWWYPRRLELYYQSAQGKELNAKFAIRGAILALMACGLVGLTAPLLIHYLTPPAYHQATEYLPILLMAVGLKLCSELLNLGCFIGERSYQQMLIDIGVSVAALVIMFILIPQQGAEGAMFSLLFVYALRLALFFGVSQKICPLPYQLKPLMVSAGIVVGLIQAGQVLA